MHIFEFVPINILLNQRLNFQKRSYDIILFQSSIPIARIGDPEAPTSLSGDGFF